MMRRWVVLFVLLLTACAHPVTKMSRPDQLTFPALNFTFPEVETTQSANGIHLYLKEDHELPLIDLTMRIAGGSIEDPSTQTGLSELFAATLETGGAGDLSPQELEAELEMMAAQLSVESSTYSTVISLSLHRDDLARGLEILADLVRRPRFDPERLEVARKQMLEQIRRRNDSPGSLAARVLSESLFPHHPFGRTPLPHEVETFSRNDLSALQQRFLHPRNSWLAVSGDVTESELAALLEKDFGDWEKGEPFNASLPALPSPPAGRILMVEKQLPQTSIMLGLQGINKDNPDMFALQVANYILGGGGFNSRMMREIRSNRGLAYSVYSYFQVGRRLPGMFIAAGETKTASTVDVVELMLQLIQQIKDQPVTSDELDLAKRSLTNSFVFAFSDTHSVVARKLRLDFFDYPADYLETYRDRIAAVSIADVQRVARKYLSTDKLQIVLVGDVLPLRDKLESLGFPIEQIEP